MLGLICFRIWRSAYKIRFGYSDSPLSRVLAVVVESGELPLCRFVPSFRFVLPAGFYCAWLFALIISNVVGSNVFFVLDPVRSGVQRFMNYVSPDAEGYSVLLDPSYCGASDHSYMCLPPHLLNTIL